MHCRGRCSSPLSRTVNRLVRLLFIDSAIVAQEWRRSWSLIRVRPACPSPTVCRAHGGAAGHRPRTTSSPTLQVIWISGWAVLPLAVDVALLWAVFGAVRASAARRPSAT